MQKGPAKSIGCVITTTIPRLRILSLMSGCACSSFSLPILSRTGGVNVVRSTSSTSGSPRLGNEPASQPIDLSALGWEFPSSQTLRSGNPASPAPPGIRAAPPDC